MKTLIMVFGFVLGPAGVWWGIFLMASITPAAAPADVAWSVVQMFDGLLLIVAGGSAFVLALVFALQPLVRYLNNEFKID